MIPSIAIVALCLLTSATGMPAVPRADPPRASARPQTPRDKPVAKTGTGTIKGRITIAETGQPIRRAKVSLDTANPLESRFTTTDLDGRYQFSDIPAGAYRVTASKGLFVTLAHGQRRAHEQGKSIDVKDAQVIEAIDVRLPRGGVVTGLLLDDVGEPAAGVRVTAMRRQYRDGRRGLVAVGRPDETNDLGQYRLYGLAPGAYSVGAMPSNANAAIPMLSTPSGAPTYFPGVVAEQEAERVIVRSGSERLLPDFTLVPTRLVTVTGTATNAAGAPAQMVMMMSRSQIGGTASPPGMITGVVKPDGSFLLNNVPPGEYIVMATSVTGAEQQVTTMQVNVLGEDVSGVTLQTVPGFRATGQIVFDQPAPSGLSSSGLMLVAAPASQMQMAGSPGRITIREDWTFEANGLAGPRLFRIAQGLPSGWMIQSVHHGATDITDKPLDLTDNIEGVLVTLTNRPAGLTGSVTDDRGRPAAEYDVVVFPDDPALGPPATTRYLRAVRRGDDGRFKTENLPAATYLVAAVEWLEPGEEHDPELLEQLRASATRVTVGWGETRDVTVKLVRLEGR